MSDHINDSLCKRFKLAENSYAEMQGFFNEKLQPRIKEKFLSHIVSVIEDCINADRTQNIAKPSADERTAEAVELAAENSRPFVLLIKPIPGLVKKAMTRVFDKAVLIAYNPRFDEVDIRVLIAHELGHVIQRLIMKMPEQECTENVANLLAYIMLNDRNEFYKNTAQHFVFKNELELMSRVQAVCPITDHNQTA